MMTFANLSEQVTKTNTFTFNSKISKNFHDQAETLFCWAFAISSMLRNSLLKCMVTNQAGHDVMKKARAMKFHKILRNEIIMGPIPKPKYIDFRKSTSGRKDKIIKAQSHIVTTAIERVSSFKEGLYSTNYTRPRFSFH